MMSNQRNYKQSKPLSELIEEEVVQQPVVSSSSSSASSAQKSYAKQNQPGQSDYFKIKEETEGFSTDFMRRPKIKKEKDDKAEIEDDIKLFDRRKPQTNLCSDEHSSSNTKTNVNHGDEDRDRNHGHDHDHDRIYTFFRRQVTHIDGEIGFAGPDIFFHMTKVRGHPGTQLKVGSVLNLKCEKVENMPFAWNAVSIYIEESNNALPLPVPEYTNPIVNSNPNPNVNVNANVDTVVMSEEKEPVKSNQTSQPKSKSKAPPPVGNKLTKEYSAPLINNNETLVNDNDNTTDDLMYNMMDTIPLYIPPNLHTHSNQKSDSSEDQQQEKHHHHHHHRHHSKHKHKKKHKHHHHHKKRHSRSSSQSSSSSSSRSRSSSSSSYKKRKHEHKSRSKSRSRKRSRSRSKTPKIATPIVPVISQYQNPFQYQIVDPTRPNLPIQVVLVHPPSIDSVALPLASYNQNQIQRTIINQNQSQHLPPLPPPTNVISSRETERYREKTPPRTSRYDSLPPPSEKNHRKSSTAYKTEESDWRNSQVSARKEPEVINLISPVKSASTEEREDRDRALISVKPPWALFESEEKYDHVHRHEHKSTITIQKSQSELKSEPESELNKLAKSNKLVIQVGGAGQRQVKGDSHSHSHSSGTSLLTCEKAPVRTERRQRNRERKEIVFDEHPHHSSSSTSSSYRSQSYRDNLHPPPHHAGHHQQGHGKGQQHHHHRPPSPVAAPPKLSIKARLGVRTPAAENAHRIITHHLNIFHPSTPPRSEPEPPSFNPEQPVIRIARRRAVSPSRLQS